MTTKHQFNMALTHRDWTNVSLNRDVASPLFQVLKNKYSNKKSNKALEQLKKYYTIMKEYIYRKIFCTGNKAFWSITLGKFLQKQIIINTNHNVKKKSSSETKNQFKSRSMQKIPLTPMKLTEDRWISPKHNRVSLSRATVLLLKGPWCTSISNMAAYPSETLIRSSGGPSIKKGVGNSIQITQALRSRGLPREVQSLSLLSPSPSFLAFDLSCYSQLHL